MMKRIFMVAVVFMMLVGQIFATSQSISSDGNSAANNSGAYGGAYLEILPANQTGLGVTGNLTIEMWIKIPSLDANYAPYLCLKATDELNYFYWFLNPSSSGYGNVFCYADLTGNCTAVNATSLIVIGPADFGTWVHIAVTVEANTKEIKFYKNGVLLGMPTLNYSNASSISNSPASFKIGHPQNQASLRGCLKDYRVWNVTRTPEQIAANYSHELTGTETGLVAYWKFNGNLNDETSYHNNLTGHNSFSYVTDVPNISPSQTISSCQYLHFSPIQVITNGFPEIAALKTGDNLAPLVKILDGSNNQEIRTLNFFDSLWIPKKVIVFDVNNDGTQEVSVMASKGDSTKIESRSLSSGALIKTIILP